MSKENEKIIHLRKVGDMWACEIEGQTYNFRRWTWGEKSRITSACMRFNPQGLQYLDVQEFNLNMLMSTLKKAPFEVKRDIIENYPNPSLIDILLQITTKINLMENVEIQNL